MKHGMIFFYNHSCCHYFLICFPFILPLSFILFWFKCDAVTPLVILSVHISNPSKGPELSDVMAPEETALGDKSDRQREEEEEADTVVSDGFTAVPPVSQQRAREKHRYHTIGHQVLNS